MGTVKEALANWKVPMSEQLIFHRHIMRQTMIADAAGRSIAYLDNIDLPVGSPDRQRSDKVRAMFNQLGDEICARIGIT